MIHTRPLSDLRQGDVTIAGGKAAVLGELIHAGFPVPPGYVVEISAFTAFAQKIGLTDKAAGWLAGMAAADLAAIENISARLRAVVLAAPLPDALACEIMNGFGKLEAGFVAVRSSATAEDGAESAWAGQLDTALNVTADTLLQHVLACWASLFTPRAIGYCLQRGMNPADQSVAVVVQKMIDSMSAGVAFSVDPITGDAHNIVIEAGWGLGEAVVSGQVTPQHYAIGKTGIHIERAATPPQTRQLKRLSTGGNAWVPVDTPKAPVLSDAQIIDLRNAVLRIENHYGFPCDVEWAYEQGKLYILQSRPITTLAMPGRDLPQKADYVAFTRHEGKASYLASFGFFLHLHDLGAIVLYDGQTRSSFIGRPALEQTLADGAALYSSATRYADLRNDLRQSFRELEAAVAAFRAAFSTDHVVRFLDAATHLSTLYRYTEFFYTDDAYRQMQDNPVICEAFASFETFKLDGRRMINRLAYDSDSFMNQLIDAAATHFNLPRADVESRTGGEIIALFDGHAVSPDILAARRQAFAIYSNADGDIVQLHGAAALPLITAFVATGDMTDRLTGQTASPGLVQGPARVAHIVLDDFASVARILQEIRPGEILVADSTIPEIMPACQKVAGIITNQGGMMSHAAIVARELGTPCLVGVEGATGRIRTGDTVLLNATEGYCLIVRTSAAATDA